MKFFEFLSRKKVDPKKSKEEFVSSDILLKNKEQLAKGARNDYSRKTFRDEEVKRKYHSFLIEGINGSEVKIKREKDIVISQISQRLLKVACNVADIVISPDGNYYSTEKLEGKKISWNDFAKRFPEQADDSLADQIILHMIMSDSDHNLEHNVVYFDTGNYYFFDFEAARNFLLWNFFIEKTYLEQDIFTKDVFKKLDKKLDTLITFYESPDGQEVFASILNQTKLDLSEIFGNKIRTYGKTPVFFLYKEFTSRLYALRDYLAPLI